MTIQLLTIAMPVLKDIKIMAVEFVSWSFKIVPLDTKTMEKESVFYILKLVLPVILLITQHQTIIVLPVNLVTEMTAKLVH